MTRTVEICTRMSDGRLLWCGAGDIVAEGVEYSWELKLSDDEDAA